MTRFLVAFAILGILLGAVIGGHGGWWLAPGFVMVFLGFMYLEVRRQ
jgi:hypothetical protein